MSYYTELGVGQDFTPDQLRRAYRSLCLECHPDRNPDDPGAEERFKRVSVAYQVLSDPSQRRDYDLSQTFGGASGGDFRFDGSAQDNIRNMVNMMTDFLENSPLFEAARRDVDREAEIQARAKRKPAKKKAAKKKAPKRKAAKKKAPESPTCSVCDDSKFQTVRQGGGQFKIRCQSC